MSYDVSIISIYKYNITMPKTKILVTSMTYRTEFDVSLLPPESVTLNSVCDTYGWMVNTKISRVFIYIYIHTDRRLTCNILGRRSRACLVRFYSCSIRFGQCTHTKKLSFFSPFLFTSFVFPL